MAIKKSELYSSLWASCDELRGGMDASQYKDSVSGDLARIENALRGRRRAKFVRRIYACPNAVSQARWEKPPLCQNCSKIQSNAKKTCSAVSESRPPELM